MTSRLAFVVMAVLAVAPCLQAEPIVVHLEGAFSESNGPFDIAMTNKLRGVTRLWDSYHGSDANMGKIRQGPFTLGADIELYISGFSGNPGLVLALEDAATRERQDLAARSDPVNQWVRYRWVMPASWVGRSVYLVAEDNSPDFGRWIGVSEPLAPRLLITPVMRMLVWYTLIFGALLVPGLAVAAGFARPKALSAEICMVVTLVASATLAYPLFFFFFWNPGFARWIPRVVLISSLAFLVLGGKVRALPCRQLFTPLLLAYLSGILYLGVLLAYGGVESAYSISLNRYLTGLPTDAMLPFFLSNKLYEGLPLQPFVPGWLASDRPPLEASFHLFVSSLHRTLPLSPLGYQAMGTALQSWVFLGLWVLFRLARVPSRVTSWVLYFCIFSGFFLFNGTFVWPKLLPTAFLLMSAGLLIFATEGKEILIAACIGVAMMCHGGSLFALPGLIAVGLFSGLAGGVSNPGEGGPRRLKTRLSDMVQGSPRIIRSWAPAALILVCYLAPWSAYQKFYDPPGDRMIKWHLAGVHEVDDRSVWATLRDAYRQKSLREHLRARWENLERLFVEGNNLDDFRRGLAAFPQAPLQGLELAANSQRAAASRVVMQGPALLNLGALGFVFLFHRRRRSRPEARLTTLALVMFIVNVAIWTLAMFEGGTTNSHHGTYFVNACQFIALGVGASALPSAILWALAALNYAWFLVIWVVARPLSPAILWPVEDPVMLGLIFLSSVALTVLLAAMPRLEPDVRTEPRAS